MKATLTIVFAFMFISAFGQRGNNFIKLSKNITTETKEITGFSKIDVSEDFKVYLRFSEDVEKVEIEANENLHEYIKVEQDGEVLRISTKSYSTSFNSMKKNSGAQERLAAYITTKKLTEIKADEDVKVILKDNFLGDKLSLDLNEDCILAGHIEVQELVVKLDEDSILDIGGSAETMIVVANEDSIIKGLDFVVGDLDIKLAEDSMAKLTVNGDISLRAKGDSYFYHKGNGVFVKKLLTGDSEIRKW